MLVPTCPALYICGGKSRVFHQQPESTSWAILASQSSQSEQKTVCSWRNPDNLQVFMYYRLHHSLSVTCAVFGPRPGPGEGWLRAPCWPSQVASLAPSSPQPFCRQSSWSSAGHWPPPSPAPPGGWPSTKTKQSALKRATQKQLFANLTFNVKKHARSFIALIFSSTSY